jgi:hypothetical protein
LLSVWDSWVENLFPIIYKTSAIILYIDELYYHNSKILNENEFLNMIVIKNLGGIITCIDINKCDDKDSNIFKINDNEEYRVYKLPLLLNNNNKVISIIIFAKVLKFPMPSWATNKGYNEKMLYDKWSPKKLPIKESNGATYSYTKHTNW